MTGAAASLAADLDARVASVARALTANDAAPGPYDGPRPRTWGDCLRRGLGAPDAPCPYAGCKHHLYLDVDRRTGRIAYNFPGRAPDELAATCALRVADAAHRYHRAAGGGRDAALAAVGAALGVSSVRVGQVERGALAKLRRRSLTSALAEAFDVPVARTDPPPPTTPAATPEEPMTTAAETTRPTGHARHCDEPDCAAPVGRVTSMTPAHLAGKCPRHRKVIGLREWRARKKQARQPSRRAAAKPAARPVAAAPPPAQTPGAQGLTGLVAAMRGLRLAGDAEGLAALQGVLEARVLEAAGVQLGEPRETAR